ncbi:MAG: IclR family transcriptional regulator [Acidimicrobiales bacterium]
MTVELLSTEGAATEESKGLNGSDRVLAILNVLGSFPDGIGLNELARLVHSPRSSVHRALGALRRANLIEQDRDSRYRLGYGLLKLAFSYYEELDEIGRIRPVLSALAQKFGETTHYAVVDQAEVMYLAKVQPARSRYQMTSVIGGRNPAYCTGVGKSVLAYTLKTLEEVEQWVRVHESTIIRHTPHTLTDPEELHLEFTKIRENGYALDREEHEPGIHCLAVPLFLTSKSVPDGAVSVTAVAQRFPMRKLEASVDLARKVIRDHLGDVMAQ